MGETPKYPLKTLEKAIDILKLLNESDDYRGCGITELSSRSGLNKSVVHRIMDTLLANGFVDKDPDTSRYRLGWGLYSLAQKVPQQNNLYTISLPHLTQLSKAVGSTVNLGILRGTDSVIISKAEPSSNDSIKVATQIGVYETAYATSLGKVMLADKDEDEIRELFGHGFKFTKMTANTITSADDLIALLRKVRTDGYAMDLEELNVGLICIARPVHDYTGKVAAAVSVSIIGREIDADRKQSILDGLEVCCRSISIELGYNARI